MNTQSVKGSFAIASLSFTEAKSHSHLPSAALPQGSMGAMFSGEVRTLCVLSPAAMVGSTAFHVLLSGP